MSAPASAKPGGSSFWREVRRYRAFYLFISPFFLIFAVFGLYPLVFSLYLSLLQWDGLTESTFVGLRNFQVLFQDERFYTALWNTLLLGVYHVPPMLLFGFLFALLLNEQWVKLRGAWRAAVFMPVITPMVVIALVFALLFGVDGIINTALRSVGSLLFVENPRGVLWLESEDWSKVTVSILLVWRWTGYNMVIMLAGLQGIDRSIYEAARVDGATRFQQLRLLTVPLMRPTFIFIAIMSLIGTVYMFDEAFVLTGGGPGTSSTNVGLYLFDEGFSNFRFGYASAAAYTVALAVFLLTLGILRFGRERKS